MRCNREVYEQDLGEVDGTPALTLPLGLRYAYRTPTLRLCYNIPTTSRRAWHHVTWHHVTQSQVIQRTHCLTLQKVQNVLYIRAYF